MATLVTASSEAGSAPPQQTIATGPQPLFTCLSCNIAFPNAEDQRTHYRSDLHRYNMKRRVASLPPVRADVFNAKVLERRAALSGQETTAAKEDKCDVCSKSFSSANIYRDHMNSRKHKDNVAKAANKPTTAPPADDAPTRNGDDPPLVFRIPNPLSVSELKDALPNTAAQVEEAAGSSNEEAAAASSSTASAAARKMVTPGLLVDENATPEEVQAAVDAKIASSRRLDPSKECLFCSSKSFDNLTDSLAHMSRAHGFFVPDSEYLEDLPGLMSYLADKVAVGNLCLYCNGRGRAFNGMEAVRKHMIDRSHCKIAYDNEEDQLELSDFYDFTSSYPDAETEGGEWEDEEGDAGDDGDDGDDDDAEVTGSGESTTGGKIPQGNGIRYGDSELELVLPSGARLGHRSLRRYYDQTLWQTPASQQQQDQGYAGGALARRLIAESGMGHHDASGTLVQSRGGNVVRARNRGEAKEAKRHIREFRDMKRREDFKTKVGFVHNSQKHFRDPLLQ